MRIELTTSSLPRKCSTTELQWLLKYCELSHLLLYKELFLLQKILRPQIPKLASAIYFNKSGRRGSNSPPIAWKAIALPNELLPLLTIFQKKELLFLWAEQGSNLRTRERTDLQSVAFNRSAICPFVF